MIAHNIPNNVCEYLILRSLFASTLINDRYFHTRIMYLAKLVSAAVIIRCSIFLPVQIYLGVLNINFLPKVLRGAISYKTPVDVVSKL
jgi:hypothetical protein